MPVETRGQIANMEAQLQALLTMMKRMEEGQKKMEENQKKMEDKMEENQKKMEDKVEESQRKMEDKIEVSQKKMEESQQKVEEGQRKMEYKMEESQSMMEEGQLKVEQGQVQIGHKLAEKLEENHQALKEKLDESRQVMEAAIEEVKQEMEDKVGALSTEVGDLKAEVDDKIEILKAEVVDGQKKMEYKVQVLENRLRLVNTAASVGSSIGGKVKPPTFDGKTQWRMYRRQFEAACTANYWTDEEKAIALIVALRGDALDTLQTVPENMQKDYDTLIAQLDMRFGDQHMQPAYQMQLRTRTQRNGETLQEFEADVARLLRLSYPTAPADFLEQIGVETFVKGVRDADTQQALLLAGHKTLATALGYALQFEAAKQATRTNLRVRRVEIEDLEGDSDIVKKIKEAVLRDIRNQKVDEERKVGGPPTCWRCGRQGHLRSSCRNRARSPSCGRTQGRHAESSTAGQENEQ